MDTSYSMAGAAALPRAEALWRLGKPRVVALITFTAVVGMLLASPGVPPLAALAFGSLGIALTASSAAALNCVLERRIDTKMARTRHRPLPTAAIPVEDAVAYVAVTAIAGLSILYFLVNPLTMALTLATFMGYGVVYTLLLKPLTPQNIVIGGASGAMPPVLGWAAVTGSLAPEPLLLFLIVFMWTPPHFWALALYRRSDYSKAGIPMLPVTHGARFTRHFIVLYSIALAATTLLPFAIGCTGPAYLASALILDALFLRQAWRLARDPLDANAVRMFRFSITYLGLLFAALVIDHYLPLVP
jgi:protoheme IX farnesyltransferase